MALKVKAVERLLKFDKNDPGSYRYVLCQSPLPLAGPVLCEFTETSI